MPNYILPGPKSAELLKVGERYECKGYAGHAPLVWESASGCIVTDVDGNTYIDWTSGVLVTNVGHCHPHHVQMIQDAVAKLMCPYAYPTPERITVSKRLVESMPACAKNLDRCFMLTTGSEATEAAMRLARRFTGRHEILSFWGGFHGRTGTAMSAAGSIGTKKQWGPLMPGHIYAPYAYCYRCPFAMKPESCGFHCLGFLDHAMQTASTGDLAAVIVEPYQGGAGFIFPPEGWLTRVQQWAADQGALFIVDEVQASFGRTGKYLCIEHEGLTPNMLCLGKGIGSGMPTAALMAEARLFDILESGEMSSTSGGNPIACAACHAVLDIMESENLAENAAAVGAGMIERFEGIKDRCNILGDVRGKGLVIGLEFVKDSATKEPAPEITNQVIGKMAEKGVVCGKVGIHGNVLRVAPPLVITKEQADESIDAFEEVIGELEG